MIIQNLKRNIPKPNGNALGNEVVHERPAPPPKPKKNAEK